jgi:lysophospholipase L1-like esterase
MLKNIYTAPGEFKNVVFTTNVRYSAIDSNESVRLKSREIGHYNWDKRLTIEFNNKRPSVCAVEIIKNTTAATVYIAGNSTVTDQRFEPWAAWGQMLPYFFKPRKICIANHAESGETLKSFIAENRMKKILGTIRPGDYLFIQFGHNDQKPQSPSYVKPFEGYKEYLKHFITLARQHKAIPVLITPVCRRSFDEKGHLVRTHGDYPVAMRQLAKEENVALIDLNNMSRILFESLGIKASKNVFVHYPAGTFPGQNKELKDDSHFTTYGAFQLAKCIVKGIKENNLELGKYLKDGLPSFDPAHPDAFEEWDLPVSPSFDIKK